MLSFVFKISLKATLLKKIPEKVIGGFHLSRVVLLSVLFGGQSGLLFKMTLKSERDRNSQGETRSL